MSLKTLPNTVTIEAKQAVSSAGYMMHINAQAISVWRASVIDKRTNPTEKKLPLNVNIVFVVAWTKFFGSLTQMLFSNIF